MTDIEDRLTAIYTETELDQELRETLKTLIIDELGCAIAGKTTRLSTSLQEGNVPEKLSEKVNNWRDEINNPDYEILMTITAGSFSTELNQTHLPSITHPGCVVIPTAIYLASKYNITWGLVLESISAGYEVMAELGRTVNPNLYNDSRHSTGTAGIFGAMAVAAKINRKSPALFREKLATAASLALSDFYRLDETMPLLKVVNPGIAAADGVSIIQGDHRPVDKKVSLQEFVSRYENPDNKGESAVKDLFFKKYPVVCAFHAVLEPLIITMEEHNLRPADIKKVIIKYHQIPTRFYSGETISHPYEAQTSLPYAVAIALQKKQCTLSDFQYPVRGLVDIQINPEGFVPLETLTKGEVTIETAQAKYTREIKKAKGLDVKNVPAKFLSLCEFSGVSKSAAERIMKHIRNEEGNPFDFYIS